MLRAVGGASKWLARVLTPGGWFAVAGSCAGITLALTLGWAGAGAVGFACAIALATAVAFVVGRREYGIDLGVFRVRVTVGDSATGAVVVTNVGAHTALPGRVELPMGQTLAVIDVPMLRPGAEHIEHLALPTAQRAVIPIGPAREVKADPLRLLRIEGSWERVETLYVHPRTVAVPTGEAGLIRDLEGSATAAITDADMSFHALREYATGDAIRHVHWKATAHTGTLMVRQFEETRRARMGVLLSLRRADFADEEEFELAVCLAASVAVAARRQGRDVSAVVPTPIPEFEDAVRPSLRTLKSTTAGTLLDELSSVRGVERAARLTQITELVNRDVRGISVAVMIAGSRVPLPELRTAALKFPRDVGVLALIANRDAPPAIRVLPDLTIATVPVLEDLRGMLVRGAKS
ncbi:DUF58 domain-containing protein [Rarobacter incanus]|uniref:Uncharacterized protein (DUF58 family) n=1 Tax=Rarobacter incanus TaxID=153494 RepID=A0A542SQW2_9MICO|nr:DUF58 domain-containing protein [Rarobacter incanus]TQK77000.1 uncharacterized protein (DUF58 family) [Rarobacter incanus]